MCTGTVRAAIVSGHGGWIVGSPAPDTAALHPAAALCAVCGSVCRALGTAVRCVPSVCSFPCCPVQLVPWLPGIVGRGPGRFVGIRAIHLTVFTFTRFSSLARHRPSHPCKPRYSRTALPRCPMKTSLSYTKDVTLCRCLLGDIQLLKKACNHVRKWEDEWHSRPTWGKPVAVSYAGLDLRMISV